MSKSDLGSAFIKRLRAEVLDSAAVKHPYLCAMRNGDFSNTNLAFKDFAFQYGLYSAKFIRYMSVVTDNLNSTEHKQILQSNLAEEQGGVHDVELPPDVLASIVGQPHALLYRRFQEAIGVDAHYRDTTFQCQPGLLWSQKFLKLCEMNECVGVGAIGLGTELIVSHIYNQILEGLKKHSDLTMTQRVFFDLHSECDERHAAQMLLIAEDLARDHSACEQIEYGVNKAINMRIRFWNKMLERAQSFPVSTPLVNKKTSTLEY